MMLNSDTGPSNKVLSVVLAVALWVGTAVLGLWEIVVLRDIVLRIYARFTAPDLSEYSPDYWQSLALGNWLVVVLAVLWIVVVIGGGEYHYRHLGQRRSWKLFGWTIAVQLFILVLAYWV